MRIKRLDLIAFGPFTEQTLDVGDGTPGLHVIHGPNEAGKSSALRALKAWLFGIENRSTDDFIHDYTQMRVGGTLELLSGEEVSCVRRKGYKGTLLDPKTGDPIDDDALSALLPGLSQDLFSRLHGIDHAALVEGGRAILAQTGDVGRSLFGAAMGGAQLRNDLLERLRAEAADLFRPAASTKVINSHCAKLKAIKRNVSDTIVPVGKWKKLQKEFREAQQAVADVEEEIGRANHRQSKLRRFKTVSGSLTERREILERQAELGEVLLLPEDFGGRRRKTLERRAQAQEQLEKAVGKLERLDAEAKGLAVATDLLDNEGGIEGLQEQLGAVQKSIRDRPVLDGKRREHRNRAEALLKKIRPDLEIDAAETLRPLLTKEKPLTSLAGKGRLLSQKTEHVDETLRGLLEEDAELRRELDETPESEGELSPLKRAVKAARKPGDLDGRVREAQDAVSKLEGTCERELSRLGRFKGSLAELAAQALPDSATVDAFEERFTELNDKARQRTEREDELKQELGEVQSDLERLLRLEDVPSPDDLKVARTHRDEGWVLVRRRYVEDQDVGPAATEYDVEHDLPDAYEMAVAAADGVGDRMLQEAAEVQERIQLETRIKKLHADLSALRDRAADHTAAEEELGSEWKGLWREIADEAGTPKEMRQWLSRVERLLQRLQELEDAQRLLDRLGTEQETHIEALRKGLKTLDPNAKRIDGELDDILGECEELVEQCEERTRRRKELEKAIEKVNAKRERASGERQTIDEQLRAWRDNWARAVEGLGIGDDPLPELVTETMGTLREFFDELDEAQAIDHRIQAMKQDDKRFSAAVSEFTERVGFDTENLPPADITKRLVRRLAEARTNAARRDGLRAQISEVQEEAAQWRDEVAQAESRLAELREQALVENDEDMEAVEERSDEKRRLAERLDAVERMLQQAGEGLSIEALEEEADGLDPDQVVDELEQLELQLEELRKTRDARRDRSRTALDAIEALDGSSHAAEAAEEAEQVIAGIVTEAEQYLRLEIAQLILAGEIEKYRKENQTPVLKRASELFKRLTLGSFSGLHDDLNEKGNPVLRGVRPDHREVSVEGMSDGTRDQLFLALRLATLEHGMDHKEPVPFVVDDILVGFDEPRTEACLEVLGELAHKTQVLVFTHHEMVADTARGLGEGAGVFVHELG